MILVDANLLVYASIRESAQHERARDWLGRALAAPGRVGLPWASTLGFLRIVTNPRIYDRPVSIQQAWAAVQNWLGRPAAWIPAPNERHREVLSDMVAVISRANDVPDAHLAALAVEHGLILATADHGFARFPGLRWENPLEA